MMQRLPTHTQLILPLLSVLAEHGPMRARDAAEAVAERLALNSDVCARKTKYSGGRTANVFRRRVRWVRQSAASAGLIDGPAPGIWDLAEKGRQKLTRAREGVLFCVATTDLGEVLWATARTAMGLIEPRALSLTITSPPFPLNANRGYAYRDWSQDRYVEHLLGHIDMLRPLLKEDGSLVLNLADVYKRGSSTLFLYQEQIAILLEQRGWFSCGREVWANPSKPKTTPYVTQQRERIANGVETFWWFAPSPRPKADNRRVLEPYSERQKRTIAAGGEACRRNSSRQRNAGLRYGKNNGGRIPFNFTVETHEASNSAYVRRCKERGVPYHPARTPAAPVAKYVKLTTEPGDLVFDCFAGSLNTAAICEGLGRRYVVCDNILEYLDGGLMRIEQAPAFCVNPITVAGGNAEHHRLSLLDFSIELSELLGRSRS